jgi:hypothetical protein
MSPRIDALVDVMLNATVRSPYKGSSYKNPRRIRVYILDSTGIILHALGLSYKSIRPIRVYHRSNFIFL